MRRMVGGSGVQKINVLKYPHFGLEGLGPTGLQPEPLPVRGVCLFNAKGNTGAPSVYSLGAWSPLEKTWVWGLGFRVQVLGLRLQGLGLRVLVLGIRFQGLVFGVMNPKGLQ